jgi:hypothetical protein
MRFFRPRYRRTKRRLGFESLESRQTLSAAAIVAENLITGADGWTVQSNRSGAVGGFVYNGWVDFGRPRCFLWGGGLRTGFS